MINHNYKGKGELHFLKLERERDTLRAGAHVLYTRALCSNLGPACPPSPTACDLQTKQSEIKFHFLRYVQSAHWESELRNDLWPINLGPGMKWKVHLCSQIGEALCNLLIKTCSVLYCQATELTFSLKLFWWLASQTGLWSQRSFTSSPGVSCWNATEKDEKEN